MTRSGRSGVSDAPIVQVLEDGKVVYRASALGMCTRALVAARQGYEQQPPPAKLQEVFDAGHRAEEDFFARLSVFDEVVQQQLEVSLPITSRITVVGHLDGLRISAPKGAEVIEVKSQSDDMWHDWKPKFWTEDALWKKYAWQISVYYHATQAQTITVYRYNRTTCMVAAETYHRAFHDLAEIRDRVLNIESLALDQDLPDCKENAWGCPFGYLHKELEPVDEPRLEELIKDYYLLKRVKDANDREMVRIKGLITECLAGRPKVLLVSGVTVSRSEYVTKAHEVKESKSVRLTITKPKERDAKS
jgi:hypothetical protein